MQVSVRGSNETFEQRMWLVRLALEFGMILASNVKCVRRNFDDFRQLSVRSGAANHQSFGFELLAVTVVQFVAMTMALVNNESAVKLIGQ